VVVVHNEPAYLASTANRRDYDLGYLRND